MWIFLISSLFLFSLRATPTEAECFTPNGTDRNDMPGVSGDPYQPCPSDGDVAMCCRIGTGDICVEHGLCFNPSGNIYWRESCTDRTWSDPACVKLFVNGTGFSGPDDTDDEGNQLNDVNVYPCEDGSYCYGNNNRACCAQQQGYFIVNGDQTRQNLSETTSSISSSPSSTSTATGSSSTIIPSTSAAPPIPNSSPNSLSSGARAGIGVGVAVGALVILSAVFWFIRRRSSKRKSDQPTNPDHNDKDMTEPRKDTITNGRPSELEFTPKIPAEMYAAVRTSTSPSKPAGELPA
ncbi:hypothetical protein EPUS_00711 [Endocarpon pusillum Z07020]|uniref:Mid2 domain-containing protein n=1 Tax=Endocarpon pusillum (strain Z07020 / HMAS-L-300199) TaxID=1263415 RepID=U1GRH2_ENDPU|nr:uncharacterized protein EPUS_00711 [Endocarpon pusillum Z07020]ERF74581.1 hypothetical protein EPUS_00711 [Endocarpon pusillum Z07020]